MRDSPIEDHQYIYPASAYIVHSKSSMQVDRKAHPEQRAHIEASRKQKGRR